MWTGASRRPQAYCTWPYIFVYLDNQYPNVEDLRRLKAAERRRRREAVSRLKQNKQNLILALVCHASCHFGTGLLSSSLPLAVRQDPPCSLKRYCFPTDTRL